MEDYRLIHERLSWLADRQLVLVVGATRWGTAWVQQCMDAHPEVLCKGAGHFTDVLFPALARVMDEYNQECDKIGNRLQQAGLPGNAAGYTVDDVNYLLKTAVGLVFSRWIGEGNFKCIAEKTPEHVLSLDVLDHVLPGFKVVHVVRDGRDEAVSAWDFNLGISRGDFPRNFPEFVDFSEMFARAWSRSVGTAKHFGRDHPERFFQVRCEDLQTDGAAIVSRLFEFTGAGVDPDLVKTAMDAAWDVSPLDVEIGVWKDRFDDDTERLFSRQCGELLKLLDYEA